MLAIQKKISKYNFNRNTNKVKYIVIHDVGTKSTAKNNVDYFSGGNRGASAHYFVDDNSIWQSVEEKNGAWHCGDGYNKNGINNDNSIGIEMCLPSGTVTAKTETNTVDLVKHLMKKYKVPASRVVRHYDASGKKCPAQFSKNNWARWTAFKKKLTTSTPVSKKTVKYPSVTGEKVMKKTHTYQVTAKEGLRVRKSPSTAAATYRIRLKGATFTSKSYLDKNGYRWLSYVTVDGDKYWIAESTLNNKKNKYVKDITK